LLLTFAFAKQTNGINVKKRIGVTEFGWYLPVGKIAEKKKQSVGVYFDNMALYF